MTPKIRPGLGLGLVVALGAALGAAALSCAPTPRFGSLRFGPRSFNLETRGELSASRRRVPAGAALTRR